MSTNQPEQLRAALDELTRQHSAALQHHKELEQQLKAAQAELARLGFMQLGRRRVLRAEADGLARQLGANQHLQTTLLARITAARAQLTQMQSVLTEEPAPVAEGLAPVAEEPAPVVEEPTPAAEEPAPVIEEPAPIVEEPAHAAEAPAPVAAKPVPRKPRASAPRKPVLRAARPEVSDDLPLPEQIDRLLAHLQAYYPDQKLCAPEVLTAEARARLGELAARSGHASPAELLSAHGWQVLTPAEARALHQGRYTTPGSEPEIIRAKLGSVLRRLEKHYPERVISRSIQHEHKSLAQDVSALSVYLGFATPGAMLTAHGFRYNAPSGGRPALDADAVIAALKAAYADAPRPRTIAQITAEHPEYAAVLKTLQNQAPKRFGMSLRKYFMQQGLM